MAQTENRILPLWSDEPASTDLLSFEAIAETVADAIFDDGLDPIALGISGSWGSGKTTVLNLIEKRLNDWTADGQKIIVVRADPWRYDPAVGPKESLITEVLGALAKECRSDDPVNDVASNTLKKLAKRVNWSKAIKMAARTGITMQLPSLDDIFDLVSDDKESLEGEKGLAAFRKEFSEFLGSPALAHVEQVVVLVDDLDRCLPETVVETLEAIRLFLSVDGMSFVIAADEERVAEAIQQKLQTPKAATEEESVASLYLHKIVQTTIPLPALSNFDTKAYLFLLLAKSKLGDAAYAQLVISCNELRLGAGSLDDLTMPEGSDLALEAATASRLTPVLYERFKGNPRRIKRFMNDLYVRQAVASRRGISLASDAIAKLMVLERLFESDFMTVLDWLASGNLRPQLIALDKITASDEPAPVTKVGDGKKPKLNVKAELPPQEDSLGGFSATMVRWAKLPPELDAGEVSGYLTLAAAFKGRQLIDESLPQQLRDIAAALTSGSQLERTSVNDAELAALARGDVDTLIQYLGRKMQDDPAVQLGAVNGILTLCNTHDDLVDVATRALLKLPAQEVSLPTVLLFNSGRAAQFVEVLGAWKAGAENKPVIKALDSVLDGGAK
ncbi:P-loop NTPase fold protein [Pseudarthrobacter sp. J75]|uniref:KAP family P-loop NTPase fold protein n=1 Tax=unclassified Pseudarthrobacter TaxID=2647000 RepID=UPI002E802769|nr:MULTISPECIES: P-loop NTPase fold protein [unclassified Pseudarthrobacter]MEE2522984.1 P-loop NTPase fold protein [Pseudarthrobacter sp. J47]MEE2529422.1 P-loop NTPase fold protein [Pseudarthrobacter sp. J75]